MSEGSTFLAALLCPRVGREAWYLQPVTVTLDKCCPYDSCNAGESSTPADVVPVAAQHATFYSLASGEHFMLHNRDTLYSEWRLVAAPKVSQLKGSAGNAGISATSAGTVWVHSRFTCNRPRFSTRKLKNCAGIRRVPAPAHTSTHNVTRKYLRRCSARWPFPNE